MNTPNRPLAAVQAQKRLQKTLASAYRRSENVAIEAIVVTELKFRDVQRQVFRANFVECAYHSALNKRPESFDCIGMHSTDNILTACVVDSGVGKVFVEVLIAHPLIGAEQS